MSTFSEILFVISFLILYTFVFLYRTFLIFKFGRSIFVENQNNPVRPDSFLFNHSFIIYIFLWLLISAGLIGLFKWIMLIPFCFALLLGRYTKRTQIKYLTFNLTYGYFPRPYIEIPLWYGIVWQNKNNQIAKIDRATIVIGIIIFFIGVLALKL